MLYPIVEIFDSIQGEGSWLGKPVSFIRFAGCNLTCPWCDTNFTPKEELTIHEILLRINPKYDVVLTGGEPMLQDLGPLLYELKRHNPETLVAVETNGTCPTQYLVESKLLDWVVCSPKPLNYYVHRRCGYDELKFVVDDFIPVEKLIDEYQLEYRLIPVWLQPEGSNMQKMWKKAYDIAMKYPFFRVGIQLHKLMNVQ